MKNLAVIILYCVLMVSERVAPIYFSERSTGMQTQNVSEEFYTRPAGHTKTMDITDTKMAYAQKISADLFQAVEQNKLIVAGKSEAQLNEEVVQLAREKFGVEAHWHKKIVRAGINTMAIYPDNPPSQIIQADDIVILDYGIIVDGYEADYARTYVLGDDAQKLKVKHDVEKAWYEIQDWYRKQTQVKASDLFALTRKKASEYGWTSAGIIAGHIVGKYPHEQPADPKSWELDVHPENHNDMLLRDASGNKRYWILEVHFVDKENNIGGYFEQLL